jgi:fructoselysine-6-P-deglycase FrlB-like protein
MGGPPPGPPPGPPGGGGSETASFLREVIQHLNGYREIEQDDEDLAAVAKVMAMLQQILAKQQKEQDAAFGSSPASKVLRRLS